MPKRREWRALRDLPAWPALNPEPFDPRRKTFIAERSIEKQHIQSVSPLAVQNIGIKVYRSTAQTFTTAVGADVTFDSVAFNQGFEDPGSSFTAVVAPYTGVYIIVASTRWSTNSTGARTVTLRVNATQMETDTRGAQAQSASVVSAIRFMDAGDEVEKRLTQSSGGNLDTASGEEDNNLAVFFLGQF